MKQWMFIVLLLIITLTMLSCEKIDVLPEIPEPEFAYEILPGNDTIFENETWEDAGVIMSFDRNDITVYSDQGIDVSLPGLHIIVYRHTTTRRTYEIKRYVMVIKEPDYHIELNPGLDSVLVDETWEDAGITVSGADENSYAIQVTGMVDTSVPGTYMITYRVTFNQHMVLTLQRFIVVE